MKRLWRKIGLRLKGNGGVGFFELIPVRYGRMTPSPFVFFRGAVAIMAADLAHTLATGIQRRCLKPDGLRRSCARTRPESGNERCYRVRAFMFSGRYN
jgi:Uncharacterized protein conserved in bacteria (DUF2252)